MMEQNRHMKNQIFASVVATLGAVGCGMGVAWTSPAIPRISADCHHSHTVCDDNFKLTVEEGSWIGAVFPLGFILFMQVSIICYYVSLIFLTESGQVGGPFVILRNGLKWSMILLNFPIVLGWVCILLAGYLVQPHLFLIGRFFSGFFFTIFLLDIKLVEVSF